MVRAEPNGDFMLAGRTNGRIDLGAGAFNADSATFALLARFTPQPAPQPPLLDWSKYYGGDKSDDTAKVQPTSVALAPRKAQPFDDVVVGGSYSEGADFGSDTVTGTADPALFVIRVAP